MIMKNKTAVKWLARALVAAGIVIFLYPFYSLFLAQQEQGKLAEEFEQASRSANGAVLEEEWPPTRLIIPALDLEVYVVSVDDLSVFDSKPNFPPAHFARTSSPGEEGNMVIVGHREGPADFFRYLDKLEKGDAIILETPSNSSVYEVEKQFVTSKNDWSVFHNTGVPIVTLLTCQREGLVGNNKRLIVQGILIEEN